MPVDIGIKVNPKFKVVGGIVYLYAALCFCLVIVFNVYYLYHFYLVLWGLNGPGLKVKLSIQKTNIVSRVAFFSLQSFYFVVRRFDLRQRFFNGVEFSKP